MTKTFDAKRYLVKPGKKINLKDWNPGEQRLSSGDKATDAQTLAADRRPVLLQRVIARMEDELRRDPGQAAANYWLAVAARGRAPGEADDPEADEASA